MKRTKRDQLRIALMFLVVFALCIAIWLSIMPMIWGISQRLGIDVGYWSMMEALAASLALSAVLGAAFIAYRELIEVTHSRYLAVADRLFEELNASSNVEARRWVFQNLPSTPSGSLAQLSPEGRSMVKQVLNSLDRVAFLTQSGWIPEEAVMPWMHPMIAKSWEKLAPYVYYERERRSEPYYYAMVEKLAIACNMWRQRHNIDTKTVWVDNAI